MCVSACTIPGPAVPSRKRLAAGTQRTGRRASRTKKQRKVVSRIAGYGSGRARSRRSRCDSYFFLEPVGDLIEDGLTGGKRADRISSDRYDDPGATTADYSGLSDAVLLARLWAPASLERNLREPR